MQKIDNSSLDHLRIMTAKKPRRLNWWQQALLLFFTSTAAIVAAAWVIKLYLFPDEFEPVLLNIEEKVVLEGKLQQIDRLEVERKLEERHERKTDPSRLITAEPYSEALARREITFTERELNALLAKNSDLAHRVAIDLADDLLSGKLLLPLDEEVPVIGGHTIRVHAGLEITYADKRPRVVLKGVSVMGIAIPNAWLGGLKNIDLVEEFGDQQGFWHAFSDGIAAINVSDGRLHIKFKQ